MSRTAAISIVLAALMQTTLVAQDRKDQPPIQVIDPPPAEPGEPLTFHDVMLIGSVAPSQRAVTLPDPVAAGVIRGNWKPPKAGDTVQLADGETKTWEAGVIDPKTWLKSPLLQGGYAYIPFTAAATDVLMLSTYGTGVVYVNGEPTAGDPYQTGWTKVPIVVRPGQNWILARGAREELRIQLQFPLGPVTIESQDATLPDLVQGQTGKFLGAVLLVNATQDWQNDLIVDASVGGGDQTRTYVEPVAPASIKKIPIEFKAAGGTEGATARLSLNMTHASGQGASNMTQLNLRVRKPEETRRVTFRSQIDGSVQYYAVRPAGPQPIASPGMIFTLHGASVEALGQADAYASKPWATIIAPTNRRPYGFDWEDIGRLDFLEVYSDAMDRFHPDPAHISLTGHSMGGHGTWQIGAQFPGAFGAIAPSAGWSDFRSYSGAAAYEGGSGIEGILRRAWSPSDTLALKDNYRGIGVYVLHGDSDDNVPVEQARRMKKEVGEGHPDFEYFEKPGAGHWWGNECVDWPPLMEFLQKHTVPDRTKVKHTLFTTASPGISASPCGWAAVQQQIEPLKPSSVDLTVDPQKRSFAGKTTNVERVDLDLAALGGGTGAVHLDIDGQGFDAPSPTADQAYLTLSRAGGKWAVAKPATGLFKSPVRSGLFKDIFRNGVVFVVGTIGTEEENAWALSQARFDSETFWYRGNGSVRIMLDKDFDPASYANRNVLLYGNAATNSAWNKLLAKSPISVTRGRIAAGGRELTGDDLVCLFIQPRADSETACVGAVSGTGIVGMRMATRVPYFLSGVGIPDWIILGSEALEKGIGGIRGAGFFGNDWQFSAANSAWRDDAAH